MKKPRPGATDRGRELLHQKGTTLKAQHYLVGDTAYPNNNDAAVEHGRPVVVIDPENREQVERLVAAVYEQPLDLKKRTVDSWASALRSLLNPPKPDEPTGLGAVVEDTDGQVYVRYVSGAPAPWIATSPNDSDRPYRYYDDLAVVRVLSEGVPA